MASRRMETKPVITCLKTLLIIYSFVFWVSQPHSAGHPRDPHLPDGAAGAGSRGGLCAGLRGADTAVRGGGARVGVRPFIQMSTCVCTDIYARILYVYTHTYIYICTTRIHTHIHIYTHRHLYICTSVCIFWLSTAGESYRHSPGAGGGGMKPRLPQPHRPPGSRVPPRPGAAGTAGRCSPARRQWGGFLGSAVRRCEGSVS